MTVPKKAPKIQAAAAAYNFTRKKVTGTAFPEKLERANQLLTIAVLKKKTATPR